MVSAYQDLDLINCNKSVGVYTEMLSGNFYKEIKNAAVKKLKLII